MIELPEEAIAALEAGAKIQAIKIVREEEHLGLKEAKLRVEQWMRENPGRAPEWTNASGSWLSGVFTGGWLGWLLTGAVLGWLACRYGS